MHHYLREHYGDIASVAGLVISIVGFVVTILGVRKAGRAAEGARQAAREAVSRVRSRLSTEDLSEVITTVREADSACRNRDWGRATERCDEARTKLAMLSENEGLNRDDREAASTFSTTLGTLLHHIHSIRVSAPTKALSQQRSKQFHEIITVLSQILGRLQSKSWEV